MHATGLTARAVSLFAVLFTVAGTADAASAPAMVVAVAAALLAVAGSSVVAPPRLTGVGLRRGEPAAAVIVMSSRMSDPVHHPVRPRAPGLV